MLPAACSTAAGTTLQHEAQRIRDRPRIYRTRYFVTIGTSPSNSGVAARGSWTTYTYACSRCTTPGRGRSSIGERGNHNRLYYVSRLGRNGGASITRSRRRRRISHARVECGGLGDLSSSKQRRHRAQTKSWSTSRTAIRLGIVVVPADSTNVVSGTMSKRRVSASPPRSREGGTESGTVVQRGQRSGLRVPSCGHRSWR